MFIDCGGCSSLRPLLLLPPDDVVEITAAGIARDERDWSETMPPLPPLLPPLPPRAAAAAALLMGLAWMAGAPSTVRRRRSGEAIAAAGLPWERASTAWVAPVEDTDKPDPADEDPDGVLGGAGGMPLGSPACPVSVTSCCCSQLPPMLLPPLFRLDRAATPVPIMRAVGSPPPAPAPSAGGGVILEAATTALSNAASSNSPASPLGDEASRPPPPPPPLSPSTLRRSLWLLPVRDMLL